MNIGARAFEPDAERAIVIENSTRTYVAPNDGWVCTQAVSTEVGAYANLYTKALTVSETVPFEGNSVQVFIPVKKGETVHMYEGNVKSLVRKFLPALGGGGCKIPVYQLLKRRCSLCLRLSRSSALLENPLQGFRSRPRQTELSDSRTLRATLHQAMGGLFSTTFPKVKAISASMQLSEAKCSADPTCLREKTRAPQSISLFVKAWKFGKTVKRLPRFSSFRATAFDLDEQEVRYGFA